MPTLLCSLCATPSVSLFLFTTKGGRGKKGKHGEGEKRQKVYTRPPWAEKNLGDADEVGQRTVSSYRPTSVGTWLGVCLGAYLPSHCTPRTEGYVQGHS